jgi:hypothetical protein
LEWLAPSEEKNDDSKEFYEELEQDFDHFPKYHTEILSREKIFSSRQLGVTVYIKIVMIMLL